LGLDDGHAAGQLPGASHGEWALRTDGAREHSAQGGVLMSAHKSVNRSMKDCSCWKEGQMSKLIRNVMVGTLVYLVGAIAQAQTTTPCPGYNPVNNTNLACEFATALRSGAGTTNSLSAVPATFAAQLSNLPVATAVSGTGITFVNGIPTFSTDSLGTILTQRGDTLGKHRMFVSFNYQRFGFGSVDGVRFKSFETVNQITFPNVGTLYQVNSNRVNLTIDQFTALGTYGLTNKLDLTLIVPFSKVNLRTISSGSQFNVVNNNGTQSLVSAFALNTVDLGGSKSGPGDVSVSVKANVFKSQSEKTSMAVGSEIRIPTGDELNYL